MTIDIIEDFRFIVIPYMVNRFKEINYEGQGGSDAKEFMSNFNEICNLAIKALEQEPTTKNNLGVDCISREQALVAIRNLYPGMPRVDFNGSLRKWVDKYKPYIECDDAIKQLPPVTPQELKTGHCKDCKWWKDSDGEYRRGCGAESKCPINTKTVYLGNGYCYKFEPQESEENQDD